MHALAPVGDVAGVEVEVRERREAGQGRERDVAGGAVGHIEVLQGCQRAQVGQACKQKGGSCQAILHLVNFAGTEVSADLRTTKWTTIQVIRAGLMPNCTFQIHRGLTQLAGSCSKSDIGTDSDHTALQCSHAL